MVHTNCYEIFSYQVFYFFFLPKKVFTFLDFQKHIFFKSNNLSYIINISKLNFGSFIKRTYIFWIFLLIRC